MTAAADSPADRAAAKGLAAIRVFVGLILLSNGLAKLLDFRDIDSARTRRS
jgi:hypothetical protein